MNMRNLICLASKQATAILKFDISAAFLFLFFNESDIWYMYQRHK